MHILREVYLESGHDELCHFKGEARDANASYNEEHHHQNSKDEEQRMVSDKKPKEALLDKEKQQDGDESDASHDHDHTESGSDRFWKLVTLLAGLYAAELLRFV